MHFRTWNEDDGCPRVNTKKDFFQFTNLIMPNLINLMILYRKRLTRNKLATLFKRAEANLFESRGPTLRCVNIL